MFTQSAFCDSRQLTTNSAISKLNTLREISIIDQMAQTVNTPQEARSSTKKLGKNGPQISSIGYGCMGLSGAHSKQLPDEERFAILDHVYKGGALYWDSADVYGDNEELLGRWFERTPEARENIFLATKFGNVRNAETGKHFVCNTPEYIHQQCNRSLTRLRTTHIDLYYMHRADKTQPIEITVRAMKELQDAGKVRYLGLSEVSAATLRRACSIVHIDAVQMEYSPFSLDIEQMGLMTACRELGVAIVAYAPLGKGLLTGSIRSLSDLAPEDTRRLFPRFSKENFSKNIELVDQLGAIADQKGCTSTQLVLAWLIRNDPLVFPIPGTTRVKNFDENMGALQVELSDDDNVHIRQVISAAGVAGGRYPEFLVGDLFADTPTLEEYVRQ